MAKSLLLDEKPLVIQPKLAELIGLNESIILQQLHYWLEKSSNFKDGYYWVYNTYSDWQEQFPFWTERTIRRTIKKLEDEKIIVSANYNKMKMDKTKWYRIDYNAFDEMVRRCGQNGQSMRTNWTHPSGQIGHSNNHRVPEITSESTTTSSGSQNPFLFYEQNGFGSLSPFIAEEIGYWIDNDKFDNSEEMIIEAMKIAIKQNVRKWNYVEGILNQWSAKGIKDINMLRAESNVKQQSKKDTADLIKEALGDEF